MKKQKLKPLNYFFFQDELHKKIHIQRSADLITAFRYSDGQMVKLIYSDVRSNGRQAWSTADVGRMIKRHPLSIKMAIKRGDVKAPQMTYSIDENRNPFKYMWSEAQIMDLHDYFASVHIGRPRKDGMITNARGLPNRKELRAMLRSQPIMGYQDEDGKFIPTWDA